MNKGDIKLNTEMQEVVVDNAIAQETKDVEKKNNYVHIKRILDIVMSIIGVILLSPVFLIIAIMIKATSRGPVFFAHIRVGKNGKKFKMYKFRTMYENAREMIKNFTPEQKKEWEENFKLQDDPRITKIGKFLRKTSLDELPQIFNILRGDLSIVGPRPVVVKELRKYGKDKDKFLSVTPGLTGYWQVNGRSETTYDERIQLELYYVDHMSFWLDVKIFFKTFSTVFKKEGAV